MTDSPRLQKVQSSAGYAFIKWIIETVCIIFIVFAVLNVVGLYTFSWLAFMGVYALFLVAGFAAGFIYTLIYYAIMDRN